MVRPNKSRNISKDLTYCCLKPEWIPKESLDRVELALDEIQAIKLSNLEWYSNFEWAKKMWISASTFNRILKKANTKIADAIINSKAIKIC